MSNQIRELTMGEMQQVNGGILPIIGAVASFAGHMGVRSVGKYIVTRTWTVASVYGVAEFLDNE